MTENRENLQPEQSGVKQEPIIPRMFLRTKEGVSINPSVTQELLEENLRQKSRIQKLEDELAREKSRADLYRDVLTRRDVEVAGLRYELKVSGADVEALNARLSSAQDSLARVMTGIKMAYNQGVRDGSKAVSERQRDRRLQTFQHRISERLDHVLKNIIPDNIDGYFGEKELWVPRLVNAIGNGFKKGKEFMVSRIAKPAFAYFTEEAQTFK